MPLRRISWSAGGPVMPSMAASSSLPKVSKAGVLSMLLSVLMARREGVDEGGERRGGEREERRRGRAAAGATRLGLAQLRGRASEEKGAKRQQRTALRALYPGSAASDASEPEAVEGGQRRVVASRATCSRALRA